MKKMNISGSLLLALCCVTFISCSSTKPILDNPTTSATLWMQNAAEYKAITTMVYQSAGSELNTALNVRSWTASLEQENALYKDLPPAVILDVDETVLDNAPFQARLIKQNKSYTPERWNDWVREEKADAIAGALAFTKEAVNKGITVFYLTNRDASVEEATYDNLEKLGFPLKENIDVLLTKNERPDWTSAKDNRRQYLAKNYRILMLFGDNLNDFLPADDITNEQRKQLVEKHRQRFGTQWFVLPNPVYGSWEEALYDFDSSLSPSEIEKMKRNKLDTKN
jgi:acid phosphatase